MRSESICSHISSCSDSGLAAQSCLADEPTVGLSRPRLPTKEERWRERKRGRKGGKKRRKWTGRRKGKRGKVGGKEGKEQKGKKKVAKLAFQFCWQMLSTSSLWLNFYPGCCMLRPMTLLLSVLGKAGRHYQLMCAQVLAANGCFKQQAETA